VAKIIDYYYRGENFPLLAFKTIMHVR